MTAIRMSRRTKLGSPVAVVAPGAPSIASVSSGNGTGTFTWAAPANNGGAPITNYRAYLYRASDNAWLSHADVGTALTHTFTGLTNGVGYYFKVDAWNSAGFGAQSAASSTVTPSTVPSQPAITSVTPGNGSASISWSTPADGGAAITGYRLSTYRSSDNVLLAYDNLGVVNSFTKPSLSNGTGYYFRVAAVNVRGTGADSAASASVTPSSVSAPSAPQNPNASGAITLDGYWDAPASNGGAFITNYIVEVWDADGGYMETSFYTGGATSFNGHQTDSPGNTYYFRVAAINSAGTGPYATSNWHLP